MIKQRRTIIRTRKDHACNVRQAQHDPRHQTVPHKGGLGFGTEKISVSHIPCEGRLNWHNCTSIPPGLLEIPSSKNNFSRLRTRKPPHWSHSVVLPTTLFHDFGTLHMKTVFKKISSRRCVPFLGCPASNRGISESESLRGSPNHFALHF